MPTVIEANALRADNPLSFMAALGVIQVARSVPALRGLQLSWQSSGASFAARFHLRETMSEEEFLSALISDLSRVKGRTEFQWSPAVKTACTQQFRDALLQADDRTEEWLTALAVELVVDEDSLVESSPFDMSVARQRFLLDALKLGLSLAEPPGKKGDTVAASYREGILGPWRYEDDQHSLGWDPSTLKMGAFTAKAPTALANSGVRAAVWLALESLPYFPCAYERRLQTAAWRVERRHVEFRWPIWSDPLSHPAVAAILRWSQLVAEKPDTAEMKARGVTAIYGSTKFKPNKYLVTLRQTQLVSNAG